MKQEKSLGLVGICRKAGKLAVGEQPVEAACRAGEAKLVVLASDAAENAAKKANKFAQAGNVPVITLPCSKEELGGALGRSVCAMAAVTDGGLADAIQKATVKTDK